MDSYLLAAMGTMLTYWMTETFVMCLLCDEHDHRSPFNLMEHDMCRLVDWILASLYVLVWVAGHLVMFVNLRRRAPNWNAVRNGQITAGDSFKGTEKIIAARGWRRREPADRGRKMSRASKAVLEEQSVTA